MLYTMCKLRNHPASNFWSQKLFGPSSWLQSPDCPERGGMTSQQAESILKFLQNERMLIPRETPHALQLRSCCAAPQDEPAHACATTSPVASTSSSGAGSHFQNHVSQCPGR
jgi:hypothetical protein